jgi:ubiquinone/menaquinone biosynthesis C-methylase UbiE
METQDASADIVREKQRLVWARAAAGPAWQPGPDVAIAPADPITGCLVDLAQIGPGQRVLDLACGGGNPAFIIAAEVGVNGFVLGLDITEAMVEATTARARRQGIANAEFRVIPSEPELGVSAESFDVATCRHGLMFMPDRLGALRALYEALKPGRRIAISTWAGLERCRASNVLVEAIARHVPLSPPELAEVTRAFTALPEPEMLVDLLNTAGFSEVEVAFVESWNEAETAGALWETMIGRAAPMLALLSGLADTVRDAIRADAIATMEALCPGGPVRLPNVALVAAGEKAG